MPEQYSREDIRQLVEEASNDDGIENLVFDLFPKIYGEFPPGIHRSEKVRKIVEDAITKGRVSELLNYIKRNNPYQYNIFESKQEKLRSKDLTTLPPTPEERLFSIEENINGIYKLLGQIVKGPAEQPQDDDAERSFKFSAKRYGIGYDIQEIDCVIDNDGSAIVQRSLTIIAYSTISSLDTYLLVPESSTTEQERQVDFFNIKSLSRDRDVLITQQKKENQRLAVEISFAPPLLDGDEAQFQMTEKLPKGLFAINLNKQQLSQRTTPFDYFAWNINRPTRHLRIHVHMPDIATPDNFSAQVRYASASGLPSERIQFEEQRQIRNPSRIVEEGMCKLTLGVKNPVLGLLYMLRWEPKPLDA